MPKICKYIVCKGMINKVYYTLFVPLFLGDVLDDCLSSFSFFFSSRLSSFFSVSDGVPTSRTLLDFVPVMHLNKMGFNKFPCDISLTVDMFFHKLYLLINAAVFLQSL